VVVVEEVVDALVELEVVLVLDFSLVLLGEVLEAEVLVLGTLVEPVVVGREPVPL
jgi:hypothetical protein